MPDPSAESATRRPRALPAALGRLLESAVNAAVALDPETRARLAALDGRAITIDFTHTPVALRMCVEDGRIAIGPAFGGDSALHVGTSPGRLVSLLLSTGAHGSLPPGAIKIAGDAELARRVERIMKNFAPDVDAVFTRVFGDVVGFQVARGFRSAFAWSRDASRALAHDASHFLIDESRDLVATPEINAFLDDVDETRERADRLGARIAQVTAKLRMAEP